MRLVCLALVYAVCVGLGGLPGAFAATGSVGIRSLLSSRAGEKFRAAVGKSKGNWAVCGGQDGGGCKCQWSYSGSMYTKQCKDGVKKSVKKKADCDSLEQAADVAGWDAVCAEFPDKQCKSVYVLGIKYGTCCLKGCTAN